MNKNRGFTLIELLVVIAIIGILAAVVVASLNSARQKSDDASRMQAVQQMHSALELYVNDHGHAPDLGNDACLEPNAGNPDCVAYDYQSDKKVGTSFLNKRLASLIPLTAYAQKKLQDEVVSEDPRKEEDGITEVEVLSGGNWDKLSQQLKPYIATLARDKKSDGKNGYGYVYVAPGGLTEGADTGSYQIYANKLDTRPSQFGFGVGFAVSSDSSSEKCPYEDEDKCKEWQESKGFTGDDQIKMMRERCEKGDEDACKWLKKGGY